MTYASDAKKRQGGQDDPEWDHFTALGSKSHCLDSQTGEVSMFRVCECVASHQTQSHIHIPDRIILSGITQTL